MSDKIITVGVVRYDNCVHMIILVSIDKEGTTYEIHLGKTCG